MLLLYLRWDEFIQYNIYFFNQIFNVDVSEATIWDVNTCSKFHSQIVTLILRLCRLTHQ